MGFSLLSAIIGLLVLLTAIGLLVRQKYRRAGFALLALSLLLIVGPYLAITLLLN